MHQAEHLAAIEAGLSGRGDSMGVHLTDRGRSTFNQGQILLALKDTQNFQDRTFMSKEMVSHEISQKNYLLQTFSKDINKWIS